MDHKLKGVQKGSAKIRMTPSDTHVSGTVSNKDRYRSKRPDMEGIWVSSLLRAMPYLEMLRFYPIVMTPMT